MAKLVILKFNGNFQTGFQVSLQIGQEGKSVDRGCTGILPPAPELIRASSEWQQKYARLGGDNRIKPKQIIYDGSIDPQRQLITAAKKLHDRLQQWLNSPSFYDVDKHLREELNRSDAIRIIICSDLPEIYQLPCCCWDLVETYPQLEIAISNFDFKRIPIPSRVKRHKKVKILAILGDSHGINLDADRHFLDSLATGEVHFLVEPTPQELYAWLWQKTWDIVFFAGHSQTIDRQGFLYLNSEDRLTIEQLKNAFQQAIANGLQLAIFNSCDGLGIAEELGKLFLPQSIVMRMPIPDLMAREFLKNFLEAYGEGDSLYLATKKARERLQAWEKQYPCATWLPTIYQNPAVIPPNWNDLHDRWGLLGNIGKFLPKKLSLASGVFIAALALILVSLIQSWGWLEAAELSIYDRLMSYRPVSSSPERVLVVTVDDRDIEYQRNEGLDLNMRGSLSDLALEQLVAKLQSGDAKAIVSDVIHDFAFEPQLKQTIAQKDNFYGICRVAVRDSNLVSISPPPSLDSERLGFSNLAIDDDGAIRRQILGMSPDDICNTSVSLSLRAAARYLDNISISYEGGVFTLGKLKLPKLKPNSGGYHLPEARGYQILLNYRPTLPPTISLRQAMTLPTSTFNRLVKDKVVLIGVVGHNLDLYYTPYSQRQQAKRLSGVIIHAQMTENIISMALGEQKPLWWLCNRWEIAWTAFWCLGGSILVILARNSFWSVWLGTCFSLLIILTCSWLLFLNGGWSIAIAPILGLLLSATITSIYSQFSDFR